jgi:CRISPR system Cascade subunit CasB
MTTSETSVNQDPQSRQTQGERFVNYIFARCQRDSGARAALKRADNPATEHQSWEILAAVGVNLTYENQRLPHATVAASIARAKVSSNGDVNLGQAIADCFKEGSEAQQAKARLRRLLACTQTEEVCRILRPLLSLIESRSSSRLNYARLLDDLLWFHTDSKQIQIKARWAREFYKPISYGGADE